MEVAVMRMYFPVLIVFTLAISGRVSAQGPVETGESFYLAVEQGNMDKARAQRQELATISGETLENALHNENIAKAFWLNIYNANVQYLLSRDPSQFEDRSDFFEKEQITIAGKVLSLEDIEHGILRHSRNKLSMGYLGKLFVSDFEETFRLEHIDYRIHFALNCGAKSCPPVVLYSGTLINDQLDHSARNYLHAVSSYNAAKNVVYAPALCAWFKADFDGTDGIVSMMKKYGIVPEGKSPDVEYLKYDWTLKLGNYADDRKN